MTTPLRRIRKFATVLGATPQEWQRVIQPFAKGLVEDLAEDMIPTPNEMINGVLFQSFLKEIADGAVSFGIRGINDESELSDEDLDKAIQERDTKAEILLGYILGVLGG
jgi:hypothetical protein